MGYWAMSMQERKNPGSLPSARTLNNKAPGRFRIRCPVGTHEILAFLHIHVAPVR
jgi:hypothetical protein